MVTFVQIEGVAIVGIVIAALVLFMMTISINYCINHVSSLIYCICVKFACDY